MDMTSKATIQGSLSGLMSSAAGRHASAEVRQPPCTDPELSRPSGVQCCGLSKLYSRIGMTLDTLISVAEQKLLVNKARKWNKPTNSEAFAEHVRELGDGEPSPPKCSCLDPDCDYDTRHGNLPIKRSGAAQEVSPEHILRNLLAVIHRDGGHYVTEHGLEKAGEDAQALVLKERSEEVSPAGSVQKITGPERPRCPLCGTETTCLSCGTKTGGDTRELKAALEKARTRFFYISNLSKNAWRDPENIALICERINAYAEQGKDDLEKLLG